MSQLFTTFVKLIFPMICFLSLSSAMTVQAVSLDKYTEVTVEALASNPDMYDGLEVQTKGTIKKVSELTGVYNGQYVGITLDHGISAYIYRSELESSLYVGETIFIKGMFHKYMLFGGTGHDLFIAIKYLNSFK